MRCFRRGNIWLATVGMGWRPETSWPDNVLSLNSAFSLYTSDLTHGDQWIALRAHAMRRLSKTFWCVSPILRVRKGVGAREAQVYTRVHIAQWAILVIYLFHDISEFCRTKMVTRDSRDRHERRKYLELEFSWPWNKVKIQKVPWATKTWNFTLMRRSRGNTSGQPSSVCCRMLASEDSMQRLALKEVKLKLSEMVDFEFKFRSVTKHDKSSADDRLVGQGWTVTSTNNLPTTHV